MNNPTTTFDQLINILDESMNTSTPSTPTPDAITRINAAPPRTTLVRSLRDDPTIQRFRNDLVNGLIRLDTANNLFTLLTKLLRGVPPI